MLQVCSPGHHTTHASLVESRCHSCSVCFHVAALGVPSRTSVVLRACLLGCYTLHTSSVTAVPHGAPKPSRAWPLVSLEPPAVSGWPLHLQFPLQCSLCPSSKVLQPAPSLQALSKGLPQAVHLSRTSHTHAILFTAFSTCVISSLLYAKVLYTPALGPQRWHVC